MISRVIRHKVEFKDLARLWGARMRRAAEWVRIMLQCLRERLCTALQTPDDR
jgi:hypothetical protein